jgi:O-antigen/teichoic acid export membrane protein
MMWASMGARVLSAGIVLPFLLRELAPGDAAFILLLSSVTSLELILPAGFTPTFSRFFGYALAGRAPANACREGFATASGRAFSVGEVFGTMRRVYHLLAMVSVVAGALLAACLLREPLTHTSHNVDAWWAIGFTLLGAPFSVYATAYGALLQGMGRIAQEQRWSAVFSLLGAVSLLVVLLSGGGILSLAASNFGWAILGCIRLRQGDRICFNTVLQTRIWPPSWRSLVGVAMSMGIIQSGGLVFAQILSAERLASFLLGLRLIGLVSEASRAPFYGKIPIFNRMFAEGNRDRLRAMIADAMRRAHVVYFFGVIGLCFLGPGALRLIGAKTPFPSRTLWLALGFAFLVERFGAMHVQVVSLSNRIIWHWANGISGIIAIAAAVLLVPYLAEASFPAGLVIGYLSCYAVVGPLLSYRTMGTRCLSFEARVLWGRADD